MKFIRVIIALVFLFVSFNVIAQSDTTFLGRTVLALDKYAADHPTEKVYLHLDRSTYMPGDTIWFKAYTVAGDKHEPSTISNVLHVELLGDKDAIIGRIVVPLTAGLGTGDFVVPAAAKVGTLRMRAYTNWMRNFGPDVFYDQAIKVSDLQTAPITKKQKTSGKPDVQFMPEGGLLINGARSKIAVKSVGPNGFGEDISGSVVDNDGTEVAVFETRHLGMGAFALLPAAGKAYKARITTKTGSQFTVDLPKARDNGFSMLVNNNRDDSIAVRGTASATLFQLKKGTKFYLLGRAGNKVCYSAGFILSTQTFNIRIDKKLFPSGVAQFTLFTAAGEPMNERLVFIQHNDQLKLNITPSKENYAAREKVSIGLKVTDKDGQPVMGSFSASVVNTDIYGTDGVAESTIVNNLLLTSDIKGYIEQPNDYFTNINDDTRANLDLLMLTQGYRSFDWKQLITGTTPTIEFDPENSLTVTGYLKANSGRPSPRGKVSLYNTKGGWFKLDTVTDAKGKFTFKELITDVDTTLKYVIQGRSSLNGKNVVMTLDTIAEFKERKSNDDHAMMMQDTSAPTAYQKQISQQLKLSLDKRNIQLKEVVVSELRKRPNRLVGAAYPDQVVSDFPKDGSAMTMMQFLGVRLRGISIKNNKFYTNRALAQGRGPMNIMLDGMNIDGDIFQTLNPADIESAEVYRTTGNIDVVGGKGEVLLLTSRKDRVIGREPTPDVVTYPSDGFYKARQFYSPKYEGPQTTLQKQDLRTTIYWDPQIITDKDGNATLTFYTADTIGGYRIVVEGIDDGGNLGYNKGVFKVN